MTRIDLKPLTIGPFVLDSPFVLAPMAGVTDKPFRALCRHFGAGMTTSEMTTADTSLWQTPKSRHRLDLDLDSEPVAVQIAGSDPQQLADAARAVVDRGAQIVDINMGCPAKKVCKKLAGSALMRDERLVADILNEVVGAVRVPVTLKTRTGWDMDHRNGVRIARIAEDAGIQSLVIHGRTRACKYAGAAEYETIAAVKNAVSIPVIANGDIATLEKSLEVLRLTQADGVMIGRGAQGQPWIFEKLNSSLESDRDETRVEKPDLRAIILGHLTELHRFYGEKKGVRMARKHITWYFERLAYSGEIRHQAVRADNAENQLRLIEEFFDAHDVSGSLAA
ncbi:MAG: tRNA dihydrouridine synthase DusB [Pseudomonadota bacterium]